MAHIDRAADRAWIQKLDMIERGGTSAPIVTCKSAALMRILSRGVDPFAEFLQVHGALLLRGLDLSSADEFQAMVAATGQDSLSYDFASTPRSKVATGVFTSTEYPAHEAIPQHNEQAYTTNWPGRVWFYCDIAPQDRGATPIADSRQVLVRIDPLIRAEFVRRGLAYVRNFGTGLDLSWEDAFGTTDRAEVESYCQAHGIIYEWIGNEQLRTSQSCQVEIDHPVTGDRVWFNQAHLFHVSGLPGEVQEALLSAIDEEDLPRNVYFADREPIEAAHLDSVRHAYASSTLTIPWQQGDVLILDNMLMSHGREPYSGARRILVAMTEPYRLEPNTKTAVPVTLPIRARETVS